MDGWFDGWLVGWNQITCYFLINVGMHTEQIHQIINNFPHVLFI